MTPSEPREALHRSPEPLHPPSPDLNAAAAFCTGECIPFVCTTARSLSDLFSRSSRLRTLCAAYALVAFGARGTTTILASFTIGVLGWEQGDLESLTLRAGIFAGLSLVVGNMAIKRFGAARVMAGAMTLVTLAVSSLILAPLVKSAVVWAVCLGGLAAILYPASMDVFISSFEPTERAQALAVNDIFMGLASNAAQTSFSFLFNPSATGFDASAPFVLGAFSCALGVTVFITQYAFALSSRSEAK